MCAVDLVRHVNSVGYVTSLVCTCIREIKNFNIPQQESIAYMSSFANCDMRSGNPPGLEMGAGVWLANFS